MPYIGGPTLMLTRAQQAQAERIVGEVSLALRLGDIAYAAELLEAAARVHYRTRVLLESVGAPEGLAK